MTVIIDIKVLEGDDLERGRILLTENFIDDPTIAWMLQKNRDGYVQRVNAYMHLVHQFYVDANLPILGAYEGDTVGGVLYGGYFDSADHQEADQRIKREIQKILTGVALERALDYEQSINDEILPNSYLLGLIAVAQTSRGKGIGSGLIKHVIDTCKKDTAIKHIMLDTANIRNIDLYERLGFQSIVVKAFDDNFLQTVMVHYLA